MLQCSLWPLGTNFSEILIKMQQFSLKKMHLIMSPAKWRPFCLGLNVIIKSAWQLGWPLVPRCQPVSEACRHVPASCPPPAVPASSGPHGTVLAPLPGVGGSNWHRTGDHNRNHGKHCSGTFVPSARSYRIWRERRPVRPATAIMKTHWKPATHKYQGPFYQHG